jgi:hypothetical protein
MNSAPASPSVESLLDASSADLSDFSDAALLDRARELHQLRCAVDAALAQTIAAAHLRGAGEYDGCVSTQSWMRQQLRVSHREANAYVDAGTALDDLPEFGALFAAGRVSLDQVGILAALRTKTSPELAGIADEALAAHALTDGPRELRRLATLLRERYEQSRADSEGPAPVPEPERFVDLGQTFDGVWNLRGALTPEAGSLLRAALDAAMCRPAPDDDRTAAERRHDAFADVLRLAADGGELPSKRGERPHLGALVHLDDLRAAETRRAAAQRRTRRPEPLPDEISAFLDAVETELNARATHLDDDEPADAAAEAFVRADAVPTGMVLDAAAATGPPTEPDPHDDPERAPEWFPPAWLPDLGGATAPEPVEGLLLQGSSVGGLPGPGDGARTDHGDRLSPEAAQRLACDSAIHRVVLSPKDLPLSLGQRVRLVSAPLRRAITARDQRCRFPGCDMPPAYTEAHHVQPWQDGGPTEPQNLVLLCGWHHHRVHDQHWTLRYHHRTNTVTAYRPDGSQLSLPGG